MTPDREQLLVRIAAAQELVLGMARRKMTPQECAGDLTMALAIVLHRGMEPRSREKFAAALCVKLVEALAAIEDVDTKRH